MSRLALQSLACVFLGGAAGQAAEAPLYQPPPAWVRPLPIPADAQPSGAAVDVLLLTSQTRLAPGGGETFEEQAARINAPEGLARVGNLIEMWNPALETLAVNRARILRNGKTLDLLADGRRFTVLRRETNLEAAMIDGELTATLQPEDLRVGDIVDVAITRTRLDPALGRHAEGGAASGHPGVIGRLVVSQAWAAGTPVRLWKTDDLPALTTVTRDGWTESGFDQTGAVSPDPPKGASAFDRLFGVILSGDYDDWGAVAAAAHPLYAKAATLAPGSPLWAEIARIRAASPGAKARALAALMLVEQQIRYFYVGLDAGGFTPAPADLTWTRRFGDCKAKTVLLLALLKGLGVEAEPALVNTAVGASLDRQPPRMGAFDHVLVRAVLEGRVYWLDATRQGDESLDILPVPNLGFALPVRENGARLEPLAPQPPALPLADAVLRVDARQGIDRPAIVHEEFVFRGDAALLLSLGIKQTSKDDADRALRQLMTNERAWIRPDKVTFSYDPQGLEARLVLDGSGTLPFTSADGSNKGERDWLIEGASIGYSADFTRVSDYHRAAPFVVGFPAYSRQLVEVRLPPTPAAFDLYNGQTVGRTFGQVAFGRTAAIVGDRLTLVATARALAPAFPAAEAAAAEAGLRSLDQYDVSVRYLPAAPRAAAAVATPDPAADPAARARAQLSNNDYAGAEATFTLALAAAPDAELYYERGVARAAQGRAALAQADLERAAALNPSHPFAALGVGCYALRRGDLAKAATWFDQAQAHSAAPTATAGLIADGYEEAGRWTEAFAFRDRAVAAASETAARASALNAGCWSRGVAGQELKTALADCDGALALAPRDPGALDSRGLVDLRLGDFDRAVQDYTAALAARPDLPTSLFGRSIAEARLGRTAAARTDADAALAKDDKVQATFAGWGLTR